MLQILAAIACLIFGALVAVFGQERRVKPWFALLCASCAALCLAHLVEVTSLRWTFFAARVAMTAAVVAAFAGAVSAHVMCGLRLDRPVWSAVVVAGALNAVTVLLTDWYFTGQVLEYPWGHFVGGRLLFIANPLSVSAIALYTLVVLFRHFHRVHPLDRNRIAFFLVAYAILTLTLLDYLPHFGLDPLGGPGSALFVPLFLAVFGYASFRYRLLEFRLFVGRAAGHVAVLLLAAALYAVMLEVGRRLALDQQRVALSATIGALGMLALVGRLLPRLLEDALRPREPDYEHALEALSRDLMTHREERLLIERTREFCVSVFRCSWVDYFDSRTVANSDALGQIARSARVTEAEVARRQGAHETTVDPSWELLVPLTQDERVLGILVVGARKDGRIYSQFALHGFHLLKNLLSLALIHAQAAVELEQRQRLDRYLAPQIVERLLAGDIETIERRRRAPLTVCFSDLKDFTRLSDSMNPEQLAELLNEYLSAMAEIVFAHGGTLDKFIGDAVMVFFGAPVATEPRQEAAQCLRMAVAMQRRLARLNESWVARGLIERGLSCRIGIHSGEAIVGSFGSHSRLDYTVIGSTVNLASRLEGHCSPDRILVSEATLALLERSFASTPRGEIVVKGFAQPVRVFEVDPALVPAS